MIDDIPPRSALYIHESAAGEREREIARARRERATSAHPPRPHRAPHDCELCRKWARDVLATPAPVSSS